MTPTKIPSKAIPPKEVKPTVIGSQISLRETGGDDKFKAIRSELPVHPEARIQYLEKLIDSIQKETTQLSVEILTLTSTQRGVLVSVHGYFQDILESLAPPKLFWKSPTSPKSVGHELVSRAPVIVAHIQTEISDTEKWLVSARKYLNSLDSVVNKCSLHSEYLPDWANKFTPMEAICRANRQALSTTMGYVEQYIKDCQSWVNVRIPGIMATVSQMNSLPEEMQRETLVRKINQSL